jgi:hypothetical protein
MAHFKKRRPAKHKSHRRAAPAAPPAPPDYENTGEEANYLRSLVDSAATVVVVLTSGEQLRGQVRYYDRDCFSLGQINGPKLFLRKSSVRYLYEE